MFIRHALFPMFLLLGCLLVGSAWGSEKYAGEFLSLGVGARALALGGSYVAVAEDATAAYWNPAGLGTLERSEVAFMHSSLFGLDSYDFVNYTRAAWKGGSVALSWLRVGVSDIPRTELPNPRQPVGTSNRPHVQSYFNASQNAFLISYGRALRVASYGRFYLGGSAKFLYLSGLGNTNALGGGIDLGGLWQREFASVHRLMAGIVLRDGTRTKLYWNTPPPEAGESPHTDTIRPSIAVAIAYQGQAPAIGGDLLLSLDGESRAGWEWHGGAEYQIADLLALRMGFQQRRGIETRWDLTAGAGLKLAFVTGTAFVVDYAFMASELGPSHRVSLGIQF